MPPDGYTTVTISTNLADKLARNVFGFAFTGLDEPFERSPGFVREINDVLLSSHSSRYALRELKLAGQWLKLH